MNWFIRWLRSSGRKCRQIERPRARLLLEGLETRLTPAAVFVVPLSVLTDGAHFHTLTSAVAAAGASGTVTVEPGTTPDPAPVNVNQPSIVIQGDPNIPGDILAPYDINVLANGVVLTNLNLGNVQMGGGVNTTAVNRSLVRNITELVAGANNGASAITQNFITGTVTLNGTTAGATSDLVANNTFASLSAVMLSLTTSSGDIVAQNQFFGNLTNQVAIQVVDSGTAGSPTTIANNNISLAGLASFGINIFQNAGITAANVLNNAINTNGTGRGISIFMNNETLIRVLAQGNELHNNAVGIAVRGDGVNTLTNIDFGGGALSSLGGNNFRGFTATGSLAAAAILMTNTPATATVAAANNMFANGISPTTVINDGVHGSGTGTGSINVTTELSLQRSFVQALYNELLGRTGSLSELDVWVAVLNAQGQSAVANGILRSPESLGRIVDSFYVRFLSRSSDPGGRAGWIMFLQNGGNLEQMTTSFVTSTEYINRVNTDFVQSLYINVLGRTGSQTELAAYNNNIQSLGLTGIANAFSFSTEYRANNVVSYFMTFLHRTPSSTEVANIVALPGDLLTLQAFILSSPEYFTNG
jgi:hypothetical protein